jgi:formylglycine-generating enzyme required for sulfatase activity
MLNPAPELTVNGTVSVTYTIEATTNLALANGWVTLTNLVLPTSPWKYIDGASLGMAKRFYRAGLTGASPAGMVLIPAGSFVMGNCMDENEGWSEELPLHTVHVGAFYMDK